MKIVPIDFIEIGDNTYDDIDGIFFIQDQFQGPHGAYYIVFDNCMECPFVKENHSEDYPWCGVKLFDVYGYYSGFPEECPLQDYSVGDNTWKKENTKK